jgi:nicotinamidase-related amidase
MPLDLHELLDPAHTAVLTMELQRGVIGDMAMIPDLANEVTAVGMLDNVAGLCRAARAVGARVVHCTAEFRADRAGSKANAPMLRATSGDPTHLVVGTPSTEVVPELDQQPSDLVSPRVHGLSR